MAEELGSVGEEYDLLIRQGQTYALEVTLEKENGDAYDLTGCSVQAHVRRRARDTALVVAPTCTVTDAATGKFRLSLTATQTAALTCGDTLYDASSQYVYDVELVAADTSIVPVMWGKVRVHREVTRA